MERILTQEQRNLLTELYAHQVVNRQTEGTFRDRYAQGCQQKQWNIDETVKLEEMGLVRIAQELILAGVMCVGITNSGRKYQTRNN